MTRLLTFITVIFLIIGIPSALAELVQPSRGQWIQWVLIASAVLAALWILHLIIWIKKKREESKINGDRARVGNASPRGSDWIVNKDGQAYRPEDEPQGEPIRFVDTSEFINSQTPFAHFLTNQRINRLLKEKKITIREAEAARRQTKNMNFFEREGFLSAIEHRAETEGQEHDRSRGSILKKYGFDPKKFGL